MKITLVVGSARAGAQSLKVAKYLDARLQHLFDDVQPYILDLHQVVLPLDPDAVADGWPELQEEQLAPADGFIIVSPEWHGMAAPALKNFFIHASKRVLAHKPALLVGVSSGRGGAYPIAELRASSYKNKRLVYLPDHIIVRDVKNVLNETVDTNHPSDEWYRAYGDYCLRLLREYVLALRSIRSSGQVDLDTYPSGM